MKIFITGGSSGIGRALVEDLMPQHEVTAPGRDILDLGRYPTVDLAPYQCLILCAGSDLGGKTPFLQMSDHEWQNTLQVNLLSNLQLIKDYCLARINDGGKIIVIGSTATDHVWPNMLPYSVSKLALEQFCRALPQELPANMAISIIRPGLTKTNFNVKRHQGRVSQQQSDQWYDSQPHLHVDQVVTAIRSVIQDHHNHIKEITVSA